jgi:hypothetical protein
MTNAQRCLGFNYTLANHIYRQATQTKEPTEEIKYLPEFDVERVKGIEPSYIRLERTLSRVWVGKTHANTGNTGINQIRIQMHIDVLRERDGPNSTHCRQMTNKNQTAAYSSIKLPPTES